MFSYEFCESSKNSFSYRTPPVAASGFSKTHYTYFNKSKLSFENKILLIPLTLTGKAFHGFHAPLDSLQICYKKNIDLNLYLHGMKYVFSKSYFVCWRLSWQKYWINCVKQIWQTICKTSKSRLLKFITLHSRSVPMHEKIPNAEFFLVCILTYSVSIRRFTLLISVFSPKTEINGPGKILYSINFLSRELNHYKCLSMKITTNQSSFWGIMRFASCLSILDESSIKKILLHRGNSKTKNNLIKLERSYLKYKCWIKKWDCLQYT